MKARKWMVLIGTSLLVANWVTAQRPGPYVHSSNPRYLTDDSGRAIYLAGSHVWRSMRDNGPFDPPPVVRRKCQLLTQSGHQVPSHPTTSGTRVG